MRERNKWGTNQNHSIKDLVERQGLHNLIRQGASPVLRFHPSTFQGA
jgi:hypothetical protein